MKRILQISIVTILSILPIATFSQSLNFNSNLFLGINAGIQNTYSNIYFQYGGNQQPWVIFWRGAQTITPAVNITVWSQQIIWCTKQVQWMYYNPSRWNRVRPLDSLTLNQLEIIDASYYQLGISGWFYTNCLWTDPNAVYGHIQHTRNSSTIYNLVAWVIMVPTYNTYLSAFDTSLTLNPTTLVATGSIFDAIWWIAQTSWTPPTPPIINNGWTGFNARLQFSSLYTNTPFVNGLIYVSEPAGYIIQWDTQSTFAGTLSNTTNTNIILSATEWVKNLNTTFTSLQSGIVITGTVQITLDLTNPTITITSPTSGSTVTGSVTISWTAQDANGIQNALIQIYQWSSLVYSNTTSTNSMTVTTLANGTYTAYVTVYDNAGNSTQSAVTFTITNSGQWSNRAITWFNNVVGADLDTVYRSNPIVIAWLATNTTVTGTVNTGSLVVNGVLVGTSATVTNGDNIKIELISADQYSTTVVSQLSINGSVIPFSVTTKNQWDDPYYQTSYCSNTNTYALMFGTLRAQYQNDTVFIELLSIMLRMTEDRIDLIANNGNNGSLYALQCFYDIVDQYLINLRTDRPNGANEWIYTAPNGKKYNVQYLPDRKVYTSPDFIRPKFFASYDTFTKHIDGQNPKMGRNHTIDATFTPVVHKAPNGKEYTIQKTNKGYMSYKFLKVKYFTTLQEIKTYIDQNNPK